MDVQLIVEWYLGVDDMVAESDFLGRIKSFFENGGDLDQKTAIGDSLIHVSVGDDLPQVTTWLIDNGANIEALDSQGWSPLLTAVDCDIDGAIQNDELLTFAMTRILLSAGADVNVSANDGMTIYSIARSYKVEDNLRNVVSELISE